MFFDIFHKFIVLFFFTSVLSFGQVPDSELSIDLGQPEFSIEQPFTVSIVIPNNEVRPVIVFPDIAGFTKKGITTRIIQSEIGGKLISSQAITQSYQAKAAGRFRLPPFTLRVQDEVVHSDGATLIVRPLETGSAQATMGQNALDIPTEGAAFLSLRASKAAIYAGESVGLTLSLFVADNYPYVLNFTALDKQLQTILKKIRPANSWEENLNIRELKPTQVLIRGRKFREYRIFQSIFFPLSNQAIRLPAVSLQLTRPRPVIGPPTAETENVLFTSKPLTVSVKSLPIHPLRGRVPVGVFRLEEHLERQRITVGKSVRYHFTITGEGNIATLPAPILINESSDLTIFPPEDRHSLQHVGNQIMGRKTFAYFIVPHQNGVFPLKNRFEWIYFNPQTARYDTLRPKLNVQAGGRAIAEVTNQSISKNVGQTGANESVLTGSNSLYTGLEKLDSSEQPFSITARFRLLANVLIVLMLLGMMIVLFKK